MVEICAFVALFVLIVLSAVLQVRRERYADAARKGDLDLLQRLLAKDPKRGRDPAVLGAAVVHGQVAVVSFLLERGADPNRVDLDKIGAGRVKTGSLAFTSEEGIDEAKALIAARRRDHL